MPFINTPWCSTVITWQNLIRIPDCQISKAQPWQPTFTFIQTGKFSHSLQLTWWVRHRSYRYVLYVTEIIHAQMSTLTFDLTASITAQYSAEWRNLSVVIFWWTGPIGSHPASGFGRQQNGRRHSLQSSLPRSLYSDKSRELLLMYSSRHWMQYMCWHGRTFGTGGTFWHIAHFPSGKSASSLMLWWKQRTIINSNYLS